MWIKSLEIENWRGFPGEQKIEFSTNPEKPVSIIHAENGHGKTALLSALKWVLHKDVPSNVDEESLIDEGVVLEKKDKATAKVSVIIVRDDEELGEDQATEYKISRTLDSNQIASDVKIQPWYAGGWGIFEGKEQNFIEQQILPKALSDIFLFNGEDLSESFKTSNKKNLEESVLKVTGVLTADDTLRHLTAHRSNLEEELVDATTKSSRNKTANSEFKTLKEEYEALGLLISQEQEKLAEVKKVREKAENELKELNDPKLDKAILEMEEAEAEEKKLKPEIIKKKEEYKEYIKVNKFNIFLDILEFPTIQEIIKKTPEFPLPITPPDRKDAFIRSLQSSDECICGTPFTEIPEFEQKINDYLKKDGAKDNTDRAYQGLKQLKENHSDTSKNFIDLTDALEISINELTKSLNKEKAKYSNAQKAVGPNKNIKTRNAAIQDKKNNFAAAKEKEKALENKLNHPITGLLRLKNDKKKHYDAKKKNLQKDTFSQEINLLNKKIDFLKKAISRLVIEKNFLMNNMKKKIIDNANELLSKYYKLGARFEYEGDSFVPLMITEGFDKEVDLSEGNAALKSIFYGASLVAAAESREGETNHIIDKGVKSAWVVDAPFSKLDGANIESCAKVILDRKKQLIVFVRNEQYLQGFEKELKKIKTMGKQYLIKRFIKGNPGTDSVLDVLINQKKVKCVEQSKTAYPYSKIVEV